MDEKENRLVEMVLAGNPRAFESLVEPYRHSLLSLAFRLTGNEEDAKEAAQEALLRAYRYLRAFDPERSFRNWLLRILVNASQRSVSRRGVLERLEDAAEAIEPSAGPAARYQDRELRSRLTDCLGALSERERRVFLLRDIETGASRKPRRSWPAHLSRSASIFRRRGKRSGRRCFDAIPA